MSSDIKLILDTFPQQTNLVEKEKIVLKTILTMQAVDQRLGGAIPVLKPTDQNLSYAFEGDYQDYETGCKNIAKALVDKGILITVPIADGKKAYAVAVLAGDGAKIDGHRAEVRKHDITKLVEEGKQLATALSLSPPLKLRYATDIESGALPIVTRVNFIKVMDTLKTKDVNWHFYAVLALAKNDEEAQQFRNQIKQAIANEEYKNIAVIDALSTPLGLEEFERYVEYSAMSLYYQGNNNQQSKDNARRAKDVLDRTWKDRIHDGNFVVWTYGNQDGEKATGAAAVHTILQTIVLNRFKYIFDFTRGLTETQLKLTSPKPVSRHGMGNSDIKGLIAGCEKSVLGKVWNRDSYWTDSDLEKEPVSIIKNDLVKMIEDAFKTGGRISIDEIYDFLESKYGFSPCNLSAFVVGFLLKEYSSDPYRCQDSEGHRESMTPDKLSEMIANYMNKKSKTTYIVSLTEDEKAFYEMTEEAWNITPNTCSSPTQAGTLIQAKMRELVYPVWCLEEVDDFGIFDIIKKYIALVQSNGQEAHDIANDIGKIARQRPASAKNLMQLLTADSCQRGMSLFLEHFENGKLVSLAKEIGAFGHMLSDIKKLFSVKHSAQWIKGTGEDEIRKLIVEYEVIKISNILLNVSNNTREMAFKSWRETLKFIGFSCESIRAKSAALDMAFSLLLKIDNYDDMLPENMQQLLDELTLHNTEMRDLLGDTLGTFMDIYAPYLEGVSRVECEEIRDSIKVDMFTLSATKSNAEVKKAAEDYRKNQVKAQMFKLWSDRAGGTKNPRQWSEKYKTPILCCVDENIYSEAKKAFTVLNSSIQTEAEIKSTIAFIQEADFFEKLEDSEYRNQCFIRRIIGYYERLLPDVGKVRTALDTLPVDPYDWGDDPSVEAKVKSMASAEYNAGGSDVAIQTIDGMNNIEELKDWLKKLAVNDMDLGVKIISNGGR